MTSRFKAPVDMGKLLSPKGTKDLLKPMVKPQPCPRCVVLERALRRYFQDDCEVCKYSTKDGNMCPEVRLNKKPCSWQFDESRFVEDAV
jgi:hypothetical protein